eukprot:TRINITY_DN849_c1_g1_i1.p1 TRINITY_DN849_c1_g1~~TRINITY_DN849_c1_g1_i1.p1  ORF type:complete len:2273 (-),score=665.98 TRINITY_DN849_c1_g1_i1:184-7002(-)
MADFSAWVRADLFDYGLLPLHSRAAISYEKLLALVRKYQLAHRMSTEYYEKINYEHNESESNITYEEWKTVGTEDLGLHEYQINIYFERFRLLKNVRSLSKTGRKIETSKGTTNFYEFVIFLFSQLVSKTDAFQVSVLSSEVNSTIRKTLPTRGEKKTVNMEKLWKQYSKSGYFALRYLPPSVVNSAFPEKYNKRKLLTDEIKVKESSTVSNVKSKQKKSSMTSQDTSTESTKKSEKSDKTERSGKSGTSSSSSDLKTNKSAHKSGENTKKSPSTTRRSTHSSAENLSEYDHKKSRQVNPKKKSLDSLPNSADKIKNKSSNAKKMSRMSSAELISRTEIVKNNKRLSDDTRRYASTSEKINTEKNLRSTLHNSSSEDGSCSDGESSSDSIHSSGSSSSSSKSNSTSKTKLSDVPKKLSQELISKSIDGKKRPSNENMQDKKDLPKRKSNDQIIDNNKPKKTLGDKKQNSVSKIEYDGNKKSSEGSNSGKLPRKDNNFDTKKKKSKEALAEYTPSRTEKVSTSLVPTSQSRPIRKSAGEKITSVSDLSLSDEKKSSRVRSISNKVETKSKLIDNSSPKIVSKQNDKSPSSKAKLDKSGDKISSKSVKENTKSNDSTNLEKKKKDSKDKLLVPVGGKKEQQKVPAADKSSSSNCQDEDKVTEKQQLQMSQNIPEPCNSWWNIKFVESPEIVQQQFILNNLDKILRLLSKSGHSASSSSTSMNPPTIPAPTIQFTAHSATISNISTSHNITSTVFVSSSTPSLSTSSNTLSTSANSSGDSTFGSEDEPYLSASELDNLGILFAYGPDKKHQITGNFSTFFPFPSKDKPFIYHLRDVSDYLKRNLVVNDYLHPVSTKYCAEREKALRKREKLLKPISPNNDMKFPKIPSGPKLLVSKSTQIINPNTRQASDKKSSEDINFKIQRSVSSVTKPFDMKTLDNITTKRIPAIGNTKSSNLPSLSSSASASMSPTVFQKPSPKKSKSTFTSSSKLSSTADGKSSKEVDSSSKNNSSTTSDSSRTKTAGSPPTTSNNRHVFTTINEGRSHKKSDAQPSSSSSSTKNLLTASNKSSKSSYSKTNTSPPTTNTLTAHSDEKSTTNTTTTTTTTTTASNHDNPSQNVNISSNRAGTQSVFVDTLSHLSTSVPIQKVPKPIQIIDLYNQTITKTEFESLLPFFAESLISSEPNSTSVSRQGSFNHSEKDDGAPIRHKLYRRNISEPVKAVQVTPLYTKNYSLPTTATSPTLLTPRSSSGSNTPLGAQSQSSSAGVISTPGTLKKRLTPLTLSITKKKVPTSTTPRTFLHSRSKSDEQIVELSKPTRRKSQTDVLDYEEQDYRRGELLDTSSATTTTTTTDSSSKDGFSAIRKKKLKSGPSEGDTSVDSSLKKMNRSLGIVPVKSRGKSPMISSSSSSSSTTPAVSPISYGSVSSPNPTSVYLLMAKQKLQENQTDSGSLTARESVSTRKHSKTPFPFNERPRSSSLTHNKQTNLDQMNQEDGYDDDPSKKKDISSSNGSTTKKKNPTTGSTSSSSSKTPKTARKREPTGSNQSTPEITTTLVGDVSSPYVASNDQRKYHSYNNNPNTPQWPKKPKVVTIQSANIGITPSINKNSSHSNINSSLPPLPLTLMSPGVSSSSNSKMSSVPSSVMPKVISPSTPTMVTKSVNNSNTSNTPHPDISSIGKKNSISNLNPNSGNEKAGYPDDFDLVFENDDDGSDLDFFPNESSNESLTTEEARVVNCNKCNVYILMPIGNCLVRNCHDTNIVLGAVSGTLLVEDCSNLTIISACHQVQIFNTYDSRFNLFTLSPPLLVGINYGIEFGPFNTYYRSLDRHLRAAGLDPTKNNHWDQPILFSKDIVSHSNKIKKGNALAKKSNNNTSIRQSSASNPSSLNNENVMSSLPLSSPLSPSEKRMLSIDYFLDEDHDPQLDFWMDEEDEDSDYDYDVDLPPIVLSSQFYMNNQYQGKKKKGRTKQNWWDSSRIVGNLIGQNFIGNNGKVDPNITMDDEVIPATPNAMGNASSIAQQDTMKRSRGVNRSTSNDIDEDEKDNEDVFVESETSSRYGKPYGFGFGIPYDDHHIDKSKKNKNSTRKNLDKSGKEQLIGTVDSIIDKTKRAEDDIILNKTPKVLKRHPSNNSPNTPVLSSSGNGSDDNLTKDKSIDDSDSMEDEDMDNLLNEELDYQKEYYIQNPNHFTPFSVPFLLAGETTENPVPLPQEYQAALYRHTMKLREFGEFTRTTFEKNVKAILVSKFQEWLQNTNQSRHIEQLVTMQLANLYSNFVPKKSNS